MALALLLFVQVIEEYIPLLTAEVSYEELYKDAEQENGPVKTLRHLCGDDLERGTALHLQMHTRAAPPQTCASK